MRFNVTAIFEWGWCRDRWLFLDEVCRGARRANLRSSLDLDATKSKRRFESACGSAELTIARCLLVRFKQKKVPEGYGNARSEGVWEPLLQHAESALDKVDESAIVAKVSGLVQNAVSAEINGESDNASNVEGMITGTVASTWSRLALGKLNHNRRMKAMLHRMMDSMTNMSATFDGVLCS